VKDIDNQAEEEHVLESLRPRKFADYIGQKKAKETLGVYLKAARMRAEPMEHILIYGPPGLGKTTLAHVVANEVGANITVTSGPAIERTGDLVSILTSLEDNDIIFIDEIHRLSKIVEEVLYPAMEDYAVDVVIGKGPSAKTLRVDLPRFTLIGATTRISLISAPMRDRFGIVQNLDFYENEEIEGIIGRSAKILKIKPDSESISEIARRSRRTPRVANRLLKRIRDFAAVYNASKIEGQTTRTSLEKIGIDEHGLDDVDRRYLKTLVDKFAGGPVGVETLSAATSIDRETLEEVVEPYLMRIGFIKRTPKGRVATEKVKDFFGRINQISLIK
jgi:Holliday junction DNA helicase RuvB